MKNKRDEDSHFQSVTLTPTEVDLLHCTLAMWNTPERMAREFQFNVGFNKPEDWVELLEKIGLPL